MLPLEVSENATLKLIGRISLQEHGSTSQKPLVRIFLQGAEWSMNHVAAINILGLRQGECEFVHCQSYPELFRAYGQSVRQQEEQLGEAGSVLATMALIQHRLWRRLQAPPEPNVLSDYTIQYAFVPIENTLSGTLLEHYELMRAQDVRICGEGSMHAELCLCCLPEDDWGTLTAVHADAMALAQCAGYLSEHPELEQVQVSDGSLMAQRIAQHRLLGCATLCHPMAARHWGLKILSAGVQDSTKSHTRYLLLTADSELNVFGRPASGGARATELIKLSLCFVLKDGVHTLADMLAEMRAHGLQLTSLYSLPITGQVGRYRFYADWVSMQGSDLTPPDYKRYLEEVHLLGIYDTTVLSKQILRLYNEQKA